MVWGYCGALTSKIYQFKLRPWDLKYVYFVDIATYDARNLIIVQYKYNTILRVLPVGLGWLTNRARYYFSLYNIYWGANQKPFSFVFRMGGEVFKVKYWKILFEFLVFFFKKLIINLVSHIMGIFLGGYRRFFFFNLISVRMCFSSFFDLKSFKVIFACFKKFFGLFFLAYSRYFIDTAVVADQANFFYKEKVDHDSRDNEYCKTVVFFRKSSFLNDLPHFINVRNVWFFFDNMCGIKRGVVKLYKNIVNKTRKYFFILNYFLLFFFYKIAVKVNWFTSSFFLSDFFINRFFRFLPKNLTFLGETLEVSFLQLNVLGSIFSVWDKFNSAFIGGNIFFNFFSDLNTNGYELVKLGTTHLVNCYVYFCNFFKDFTTCNGNYIVFFEIVKSFKYFLDFFLFLPTSYALGREFSIVNFYGFSKKYYFQQRLNEMVNQTKLSKSLTLIFLTLTSFLIYKRVSDNLLSDCDYLLLLSTLVCER